MNQLLCMNTCGNYSQQKGRCCELRCRNNEFSSQVLRDLFVRFRGVCCELRCRNKCETCLPSASLATGLNMFVLCYKIKWAKERSNRESRGFVTEGVDGRMAEYIQTNTQGLHGSVVHATVKEYLKILNYLNYSNYSNCSFGLFLKKNSKIL